MYLQRKNKQTLRKTLIANSQLLDTVLETLTMWEAETITQRQEKLTPR